MNNILVSGYENGEENVMVFAKTINAEILKGFFDSISHSYTDIADVKEEERQYHVFEPLWMDHEQEVYVLKELTKHILRQPIDKQKSLEFNILSPDGFTIHWDDFKCTPDTLFEEVKIKFTEWKDRFQRQGYYSSNTEQISLDELKNYCTFILINPDPEELKIPIHKKNLSFL